MFGKRTTLLAFFCIFGTIFRSSIFVNKYLYSPVMCVCVCVRACACACMSLCVCVRLCVATCFTNFFNSQNVKIHAITTHTSPLPLSSPYYMLLNQPRTLSLSLSLPR